MFVWQGANQRVRATARGEVLLVPGLSVSRSGLGDGERGVPYGFGYDEWRACELRIPRRFRREDDAKLLSKLRDGRQLPVGYAAKFGRSARRPVRGPGKAGSKPDDLDGLGAAMGLLEYGSTEHAATPASRGLGA